MMVEVKTVPLCFLVSWRDASEIQWSQQATWRQRSAWTHEPRNTCHCFPFSHLFPAWGGRYVLPITQAYHLSLITSCHSSPITQFDNAYRVSYIASHFWLYILFRAASYTYFLNRCSRTCYHLSQTSTGISLLEVRKLKWRGTTELI